ncbi:MAG TPA: hypothetical protein VMS94_02280 [Acidobacteriota bacterium]|nr:hypothetical protein [Acidobacteriota bacterium]
MASDKFKWAEMLVRGCVGRLNSFIFAGQAYGLDVHKKPENRDNTPYDHFVVVEII